MAFGIRLSNQTAVTVQACVSRWMGSNRPDSLDLCFPFRIGRSRFFFNEAQGLPRLGLGGPGHGPVFGTTFGPNLNSVSVSVHLGHGSVRSKLWSLLTMDMCT